MSGDIDGISYQSDIDGTTNKYLDAQSLTTPKTGFPASRWKRMMCTSFFWIGAVWVTA
jgi:hypothetical protein